MIKWIAVALLCCEAAFAQSTFGGGQVRSTGTITAGHCASFVSATKIQDSGAACGGGAGTINPNNGIAGANAFYAAAGGSTTISPTSGLSYDSVGNATLAQGTIVASTPAFSETTTWNAGAVVFSNSTVNITATASAALSKALDIQIGGASKFTMGFLSANAATPQMAVAHTAGLPNFVSTLGGSTGWDVDTGNGRIVYISAGNNAISIGRVASSMYFTNAPGGPCWVNSADTVAGTVQTCISGGTAGVVSADTTALGNGLGTYIASAYQTKTNCAAVGTAANPSVASCTAAAAGSFSCATNASGGTCQVNTTAVTANSEIFITQRSDTTTGTRLGVTCNTTLSTVLPEITAVTAATSFTINLGTIATNPECFSYYIVN